MRVFLTILICLVCSCSYSYGQQDSLRVYITGVGYGEKYKVIYEGKELLRFKTEKHAGFKEHFDIPFKPEWKRGDRMYSLYILRKSGLSFFWKELDVVAHYQDKKYLVLKRDFRFRNAIAFDYNWLDIEPEKPAGFGH